ncbi:DUF523 domain-containing protein [Thalassotalea sp. G2M2-11]|uniref:DUF523 domain-containing protein n=1 Tax=Thalassotalea sp. G2M2-11 TaxID=2787627 RepID=UPI0019D107EF|nr:DUF523 domain-containing protein [Thalassotalea sp. G2M2-11]
MEKILISACFLGQKVRYDGGHQLIEHPQLLHWQQQGRLISVCPEVCGGLAIPRLPAERNQNDQRVYTKQGHDVTDAFERGARHALALCQQHDIKFALLKESSPSCGSQTIYDGSFSSRKIAGQGITAALLTTHKIQVFSEQTLEQLIELVAHC